MTITKLDEFILKLQEKLDAKRHEKSQPGSLGMESEVPGMPKVPFKLETVNEDTKALLVRMAEQGKIIAQASQELVDAFKDHALNGKPEGDVVADAQEKLYDALDAIEAGAKNFGHLMDGYHVETCENCKKVKTQLTEKIQDMLTKLGQPTDPDAPAFKDEEPKN